jgi:hypothetical protein
VPTLVYLAGLTCNEDTGPWKSGLVRAAASHSLGLLFPDTSPRGANLPGEDDAWDFGTGAGFYLTASTEGFDRHYDMRSLVVDELPEAIKQAGLPIVRPCTRTHPARRHLTPPPPPPDGFPLLATGLLPALAHRALDGRPWCPLALPPPVPPFARSFASVPLRFGYLLQSGLGLRAHLPPVRLPVGQEGLRGLPQVG